MYNQDKDLKLVQLAVDQLIEHFDTVQVLVTRCNGDEDGTVSVSLGAGNWFARYGHVKDWIVKEEEKVRKEVRLEE